MIRAVILALLVAVAPAAAASRYNFDYAMNGAEAVGLARSFDDGRNTVLAFDAPVSVIRPTITSADGTVLHYRELGRYAVLPGLQRHVLIYSRGVAAQVRYVPPHADRFVSPVAPPSLTSPQGVLPSPPVRAAVATPSTPPTPQPNTRVAEAAPTPTTPQPAESLVATAPKAPAGPTEERALYAATLKPEVPAPAMGATTAPPAAIASDPLVIRTDPLPPPAPKWTAKSGAGMRNTIEAWAKQAGWTVVWDAAVDYDLVGEIRFEGSFLDALRQVLKAQASAERPLRGEAYTRQQLIHITE